MPDFNQQVIEEFRANAGRVGGGFEGMPMRRRLGGAGGFVGELAGGVVTASAGTIVSGATPD